jgi:hypothetical protein
MILSPAAVPPKTERRFWFLQTLCSTRHEIRDRDAQLYWVNLDQLDLHMRAQVESGMNE